MIILEQVRCPRCNRRLMDLSGQAEKRRIKCKSLIYVDTVLRKIAIKEERPAGHA